MPQLPSQLPAVHIQGVGWGICWAGGISPCVGHAQSGSTSGYTLWCWPCYFSCSIIGTKACFKCSKWRFHDVIIFFPDPWCPTITGPCVSLRKQPSPQGKPRNSLSNPSFSAQSQPASLNMEDLHISQWPAYQKRTQTPLPTPALCLPWVAPSSSPIPCVAWTSICSLKLSQDSNA